MKIQVVNHEASWQQAFVEENTALQQMLAEQYVSCFHIGSTAVPNLKAKPIVDMLLVVTNINELDEYNEKFAKLGYEAMGEYGITNRRYYRKNEGETRTHQIHTYQFDNASEITRHLAFSRYLTEHHNMAVVYGELKSQLAKQFPHDMDKYCDGKNAFIKKVERDALKWYWQQ